MDDEVPDLFDDIVYCRTRQELHARPLFLRSLEVEAKEVRDLEVSRCVNPGNLLRTNQWQGSMGPYT